MSDGREGFGVGKTVRQIEFKIGMHIIWMGDEASVEYICRWEEDFF